MQRIDDTIIQHICSETPGHTLLPHAKHICRPLLYTLQRLHHINMIQYTVCNQIHNNSEPKG